MAHFIKDNPDLQFYLDRWIDWGALRAMSEIRTGDPDAPESDEEAAEFWKEILDLIADFLANEIAPHGV
jgi:hypothetical protein